MSDWAIQLTSSAVRSLDRLAPRIVPAVIEFVYGPLAEHPKRVGKPLRAELEGLWSARRGDYRILYEIRDAPRTVLVHRVARRSEVYHRS